MVIAFLFATLILFAMNLVLNIINLVNGKEKSQFAAGLAIFVALLLLSWNIIAIIMTL